MKGAVNVVEGCSTSNTDLPLSPLPSRHLKLILTYMPPRERIAAFLRLARRPDRPAICPRREVRQPPTFAILLDPPKSPFPFTNAIYKPFARFSNYHTLKTFIEFVAYRRPFSSHSPRVEPTSLAPYLSGCTGRGGVSPRLRGRRGTCYGRRDTRELKPLIILPSEGSVNGRGRFEEEEGPRLAWGH